MASDPSMLTFFLATSGREVAEAVGGESQPAVGTVEAGRIRDLGFPRCTTGDDGGGVPSPTGTEG